MRSEMPMRNPPASTDEQKPDHTKTSVTLTHVIEIGNADATLNAPTTTRVGAMNHFGGNFSRVITVFARC